MYFTLDKVNKVKDWLGQQKFHVKWFNEFNLDAEEDGKVALVRNSMFIRFHCNPDVDKKETVVDFNIFAAFKRTSLSFYLSPCKCQAHICLSEMLSRLTKGSPSINFVSLAPQRVENWRPGPQKCSGSWGSSSITWS